MVCSFSLHAPIDGCNKFVRPSSSGAGSNTDETELSRGKNIAPLASDGRPDGHRDRGAHGFNDSNVRWASGQPSRTHSEERALACHRARRVSSDGLQGMHLIGDAVDKLLLRVTSRFAIDCLHVTSDRAFGNAARLGDMLDGMSLR